MAMHNRLIPKELPKTGDLPWLPWTIGGAAVLSLGGLGVLLALRRRKRNDKTREERKRKMDTKAIILVVLCAVILGGLVFLHIRNRRRK